MRLPRMTTRRWIVVVAITAMFVEIYRESKLSSQYRQNASLHRLREAMFRGDIFPVPGKSLGWIATGTPNASLSAYHAAMGEKYEYAARHPWRAVEPDPPEPSLALEFEPLEED